MKNTFNHDNIPEVLKALPQWVLWKLVEKEGEPKPLKVPCSPITGGYCNAMDSAAWVGYEQAVTSLTRFEGQFNGLGFILKEGGGIVCIDLDNALDEEGIPLSWCQEILDQLPASYTEVSQSGRGLHWFGLWKPSGHRAQFYFPEGHHVEIYHHKRFIALTGRLFQSAPTALVNAQAAIDGLYSEWVQATQKKPYASLPTPYPVQALQPDEVVLEQMFASKKGERIRALWKGDMSAYGDNHSRADMALTGFLTRFCGGNRAQVERLFGKSALAQREKWLSRPDYPDRTINKALDSYGPSTEEKPGLPEILITGRPVPELSVDALNSLLVQNEPSPFPFMNGRTPVRLVSGKSLTTEAITGDILRYLLNRSVAWRNRKKEGIVTTDCPEKLIKDILASEKLPFPVLNGITQIPLFSPDGSLISTPGYHESLGYYLDLDPAVATQGGEFISNTEAVEFINTELLSDFPFEDAASKANAWGLLLLPFIRHLIEGHTPLHLIDAPTPGSGKTLLANLVTSIATGVPVSVTAALYRADEWPKVLLSVLQTTPGFVVLDNLCRKLDSGDLASVLTSESWSTRVLCVSNMKEVAVRNVWLATGNNTQVSHELSRRIVPIRLSPTQARPNERNNFRHTDMLAWVAVNRSKVLQACLSIIDNWFKAGSPLGKETFNSYNHYGQVIGGILSCAGIEGFLANQRQFHEQADDETDSLFALVSAWWNKFKSQPITVRELSDLTEISEDLETLTGVGFGDHRLNQRLGKLLKSHKDRIFGSRQIKWGSRNHANTTTYQLIEVGTGA